MKIVISGGPGTGKSSIINKLENLGYSVFHESSREIIQKFKKLGHVQLFLSDPIKFSEILLQNRLNQYLESNKLKNNCSFFDRGIPDILAYLNYKKIDFSKDFNNYAAKHKYDIIFISEPWEKIYKKDQERYESFKDLVEINKHIKEMYMKLGYKLIILPNKSINERVEFILDKINE